MTAAAPPPTAHRFAVLTHTVEVAAFGPDGVFDPAWLSSAAGELIELCHDLLGMAANARHGDTLNGGHPADLVGANRGWR